MENSLAPSYPLRKYGFVKVIDGCYRFPRGPLATKGTSVPCILYDWGLWFMMLIHLGSCTLLNLNASKHPPFAMPAAQTLTH